MNVVHLQSNCNSADLLRLGNCNYMAPKFIFVTNDGGANCRHNFKMLWKCDSDNYLSLFYISHSQALRGIPKGFTILFKCFYPQRAHNLAVNND